MRQLILEKYDFDCEEGSYKELWDISPLNNLALKDMYFFWFFDGVRLINIARNKRLSFPDRPYFHAGNEEDLDAVMEAVEDAKKLLRIILRGFCQLEELKIKYKSEKPALPSRTICGLLGIVSEFWKYRSAKNTMERDTGKTLSVLWTSDIWVDIKIDLSSLELACANSSD